jgi:hypothetical protein
MVSSYIRTLTSPIWSLISGKVYSVIQKYYSIFADKGQFVPVKDYSCVIDTGLAKPITIKKIHYGPQEIPNYGEIHHLTHKARPYPPDPRWQVAVQSSPSAKNLTKKVSQTSPTLFGVFASIISC